MDNSKDSSPRPSRAALHHWRQDQITAWVMGKLLAQFRPLKPWELARSWEEQHKLAGNQEVLRAIDRLCDE